MSKLLLASVAAIGLLLAGPQKASAQTVFACVSSAANSPIIIEPTANANCPPNTPTITWTKVTLSTTPGPIAERQYNCFAQQVENDITFVASDFGFGTTLPTGTTPFSSFLLQPGLYQASLSIASVTIQPPQISSSQGFTIRYNSVTDNTNPPWFIPSTASTSPSPVIGDRLFSVTEPTTSV